MFALTRLLLEQPGVSEISYVQGDKGRDHSGTMPPTETCAILAQTPRLTLKLPTSEVVATEAHSGALFVSSEKHWLDFNQWLISNLVGCQTMRKTYEL